MADKQLSSKQSEDASSTSVPSVQSPASDSIGSGGSTSAPTNQDILVINPTASDHVATPFLTNLGHSDQPKLLSSYGDKTSDPSQFPMQHATQLLPSNTVPLATTQYTSSESQKNEISQSNKDSVTDSSVNVSIHVSDNQYTSSSNVFSKSISMDPSVVKDSIIHTTKTDAGQSTEQQDVVSSRSDQFQSSISSSLNFDNKSVLRISDSSAYEPSVSETDSATQFSSQSSSGTLSSTSMATAAPQVPSDSSARLKISASASLKYEATSRELFSPMTPRETSYVSSAVAIDSDTTLKTTPAVPFTPPSIKPVGPSDTGETSLLGGGLSDNIVYIGVPLCGLGILIFIIVCIICLRKRKAKTKSSPAKNHMQDLWVNSQAEIPLSTLGPLHEANGGEVIGGQKDLALMKAHQQKQKKAKYKHSKNKVNESEEDDEKLSVTEDNDKAATSSENEEASDETDVDENDNVDDAESNETLSNAEGEDDDGEEEDVEEVENDDSEAELANIADNNVDDDEDGVQTDDEEGCTTYECLYDFDGKLETHLWLRKGDLVRVHRKEETGWWRGAVGDQTGWFPSNYVKAVSQDKLENENEVEMHNDSHVTSFMVKRRSANSPTGSYPTEEDIQAEPIYCKIQPKEKRQSLPKVADKTPPKHAPLQNRENTPTPIEEGTRYIAIYQYGGHFHGELSINKGDIILGREQDRNGWMNGYNETSKEDGWFPAVYVEKLEKDEPTQLDPDPASYQHLEANTDNKQDLVGIVHHAVHSFRAEKAGDLEFEVGDFITVFQILENGWWLGCKDKTVGWFPGSYVEMIDQPSSSGKSSPSPTNVSKSSSESPVTVDENRDNNKTTPQKQPKLRPARKAPPPPKSDVSPEVKNPTSGGSKIPKISSAKGAPPTPPIRSGTSNVSPLYETIGTKDTSGHVNVSDKEHKPVKDGLYELIKHPDEEDSVEVTVNPKDKNKPEVPKRYIKPKLVNIPRSEVNMPNNLSRDSRSLETSHLRPPPPPRPIPPRLGPVRSKLNTPHPFEHQQQSEEEEGFFNVTPQRKFDEVIRQDSSDLDQESTPYKGLSSFASFGSSFGKKENISPAKNENLNISQTASPVVNKDIQKKGIPKLVKQKSISDDEFKMAEDNSSEQKDIKGNLEKNEQINQINTCELDKPDQLKMESGINLSNTEAVIPASPKKKEKPVSKLAPPKHISLQPVGNVVTPIEHKGSKSPDTPVSKIPRAPGVADSVSKIPMSRKDSPGKRSEESKVTENILESNTVNNTDDMKSEVHNGLELNDNAVQSKDKIDNTEMRDSLLSDMRPRTESFDKPPVAPKPKSKGLPKLLPKPKAGVIVNEKEAHDEQEAEKANINQTADHSKSIPTSPVVRDLKSESETEQEEKLKDESKVSKIPLGSKIAQKSPQIKGKKSQIPASPLMKNKGLVQHDTPLSIRKTSESDSDAPTSSNINLKQKSESPRAARKASPRQQMTNSEASLRNRSNSPRSNRTGIPTTVRQRSNSPATKLTKPSSISSPGAASPSPSSSKPSSLLPPKKVTNSKGRNSPNSEPNTTRSQSTPSPDAMNDDHLDQEVESLSPKPDRPSKPPRIQKQKSEDKKPPKHGKSLLPVIHKSMDAGGSQNGISSPSTGSKTKRGIPVAKPPRPPAPRSPSEDEDHGLTSKTSLFQAVRGYTALSDEELTFTEGTFVKELSDCDRAGWYVGMLADGTTGIYPANYVVPSPLSRQSEA